METEFIYWRHHTPIGIKVEEISGGEDKSGTLWQQMALQVYAENGREEYREIGHFPSGAPFLHNSAERISISHCPHKLIIATLPPAPDVELNSFSPLTALGVDVESSHRKQILKLRERFLSEAELDMIPADNVAANITAWTAKEALYKAAMVMSPDFRKAIELQSLPVPAPEEVWLRYISSNEKPDIASAFGRAFIFLPSGIKLKMNLYSYMSGEDIVTMAYADDTLRFQNTGS